MAPHLTSVLERWRHQRRLTLDLLASLPDEPLIATAGRHMWMLGTQFRHLLRVQAQYMEAISVGRILPPNPHANIPTAAERSVQRLFDLFSVYDYKLASTLGEFSASQIEEFRIDWALWGETTPVPLTEHLQRLADHEILHRGQMAMYVRTFGLPFPRSWKTWNL